ncbi:MAG TPA: TauD/TfdA family dioxygenase [Roseovarius sp.]|nr:TauD/TfdA family dioxygenase [Roseovarius sp.]
MDSQSESSVARDVQQRPGNGPITFNVGHASHSTVPQQRSAKSPNCEFRLSAANARSTEFAACASYCSRQRSVKNGHSSLAQRDFDRRLENAEKEAMMPPYLNRFRMNAGECFVFDNHRIVHGREAYTASSGDRYLRECYIDRGELRSNYRALVKKGAA